MSRTNQRGASIPSPVEHYFEWDSSGQLSYWDKDKKQKVLFPKVGFAILDRLNTVGGFNLAANKRINGTEVRRNDEIIDVYIGNKKVASDIRENLKKDVDGLKSVQSLYIGVLSKKKPMAIAQIKLIGSSYGAWIGFENGKEDYEGKGKVNTRDTTLGVNIVGATKLKTHGTSKWHEPIFEAFNLSEAEQAEADALDVKLQEYFDSKLGASSVKEMPEQEEEREAPPEIEEVTEDAQDMDDLPF